MALHSIVAGATTLVPCSMDAMSEEGSFQYEGDVGDLIAALSEVQCHRSCSKKAHGEIWWMIMYQGLCRPSHYHNPRLFRRCLTHR